MTIRLSKLAADRLEGKNQANNQRYSILDAAEAVFLEKGLESVKMSDIAAATGISRVSLYCYIPDRDPIAFEIAARMLKKLGQLFCR